MFADRAVGSGVVQDKVQLLRRKFFCVRRIEKVKVHQHQLPVTDLSQRFKHQIHPNRFARAVDFLANISGHAREFQRAQIFVRV